MTKSFGIKATGALILSLLLLTGLSYGGEQKIVVKVNTANVRLKPDITSPVVGKAPMGLILSIKQKTGNWYLIELPPDGKGVAVKGYIHESVVQAFVEETGSAVVKPASSPPARKQAKKPVSAQSRTKKLFFRIGAGYGTKSFSANSNWTFTMYNESGSVTERYSVDASGVTFDIGLGYMLSPNLGVEISFVPASGKSRGTFSGEFPHPFYFDLPRTKDWTAGSLKYAASEINLDLLYAFPVTSRIGGYVMGGGTYFLGVKLQTLKTIDYTEIAYPYFDLNLSPHYPSSSANCFGFNAGGGLDYRMNGGLSVNLNVRFSSGSAKIKVDDRTISLQPGGIKGTAGIKYAF